MIPYSTVSQQLSTARGLVPVSVTANEAATIGRGKPETKEIEKGK